MENVRNKLIRVLMLVALAVGVIGLCATAGCSPSIGAWSARGRVGLANDRANLAVFYQLAAAADRIALERVIDATYEDIRRVRDGDVVVPAMIPGEADTVLTLDDEWLNENHAGLMIGLGAYLADTEMLAKMYADALANIDSTTEAFDQIDRLNRVWAMSNDQTEIGLDAILQYIKRDESD